VEDSKNDSAKNSFESGLVQHDDRYHTTALLFWSA